MRVKYLLGDILCHVYGDRDNSTELYREINKLTRKLTPAERKALGV
jgi:hypothetical protein